VPGYFAQSAFLSQLHGFFGFNDIQSLAITNDLAFTSVTLTATVSETNVGAGVLNYTPSSDDAFVFYYATTQTNDPGPFLSIVPLPPPPPASTTNLVTFDDLPDQTSIPNGYAQLNWSGFEVITAIGDGYTSGLISPPNVAFNPYGYDASISSSTPFNLISAYLTAAVVPTMEVQVEGWVGTDLVYDQTYGLSESSPTLVNFNYAGVTQVTFIGSDGSPFVMDNLTVSSPSFTNSPSPSPSPTNAPSQVNLGKVQVSKIGHYFFTRPFPLPGMAKQVSDYLVDQRQVSGGGAVLPSVTADFDTHNQFVLTITAPPGQQFMVHVPDGQSVHLAALLDWQATNVSSYGPSAYGTTVVSFGNLYGTAPGYFTQSAVLSQLHGFFGFNDIQSLAITNDLAFTSVALTATVPETNVGAGVLNYTPSSDDAFVFYYATTQTNDPGPFVSLEQTAYPIGPEPDPVGAEPVPLVRITIGPNGDITVTFTGKLQSASQVNGPFTDVPGNPQGTYTIPKASLSVQQHFRARR
jgi:hypothetical protein